eukprot:672840-Prymnesium_polylepis.1
MSRSDGEESDEEVRAQPPTRARWRRRQPLMTARAQHPVPSCPAAGAHVWTITRARDARAAGLPTVTHSHATLPGCTQVDWEQEVATKFDQLRMLLAVRPDGLHPDGLHPLTERNKESWSSQARRSLCL